MQSDISRIQVLLVYRRTYNPQAGISHVGLGVACLNIAKVLIQNGIRTLLEGAQNEGEILTLLEKYPQTTHLVIAAPWVRIPTLSTICARYPYITVAVNCHSNVAFLQAEPAAIRLTRHAMDLEAGLTNFHVAGNSERFCEAMLRAFCAPCTYLPNLYYLDHTSGPTRPGWPSRGGVLHIGMFGCPRTQKNFLMGAMAALIVAQDLKVAIHLHVNSGRNDGGEARRIWDGLVAMTERNPYLTLVDLPWCTWPQFRHVVGIMDICMQPSNTESFNLVTADAAAMGVPTVATEAIDWVPAEWRAPADDASAMARTAMSLIFDPAAPQRGYNALARHNEKGVGAWLGFLAHNETGVAGRPYAERNQPVLLKRAMRLGPLRA